MMKIKTLIAVAALVAVSGCVIERTGTGTQPVQQTGFEGTWGDTGGVATSTLVNGSFVSTANDTGNRVAEGTYRQVDGRMIELSFTSLLRNTQVRANCILATQNQLNCTNDSGQQFSLIRAQAFG